MSLTLRVLAPDQSVFDGTAEEVILPSTTGQVGILPGHVTMLAALDTGVMRLRSGGAWSTIALMGGFAEVEADEGGCGSHHACGPARVSRWGGPGK